MRVNTNYEKEMQEARAFQDKLVAYQRDNGLRGFFPLPWAEEEGLWSASILVKNARNPDIVEFGGMSYVLGVPTAKVLLHFFLQQHFPKVKIPH